MQYVLIVFRAKLLKNKLMKQSNVSVHYRVILANEVVADQWYIRMTHGATEIVRY